MRNWFRSLDDILRGRTTSIEAMAMGHVEIPVRELVPVLLQLGAFYGFCMGWFAVLNRDDPEYMQIIASMLKVPLLFGCTFLITLPSLYVFNALVGSRLTLRALVGLVVAAMAVALAVLAGFGPIVGFFSLTTTGYAFMKIFHVVIFTVAGILGLRFLRQTLQRLTDAQQRCETEDLDDVTEDSPRHLAEAARKRHVRIVFVCWMAVFAIVGSQMSWVLRPFIGEPDVPFQWFRERRSSFVESVWQTTVEMVK
jgi:hypothetical protein